MTTPSCNDRPFAMECTSGAATDIIMRTPMAMLEGAKLLAEGTGDENGLGDLVVVDVGGATTDVHSIANGLSLQEGVVMKGIPEPYAKRTVGNLGHEVPQRGFHTGDRRQANDRRENGFL